jgi:hypothetical protein
VRFLWLVLALTLASLAGGCDAGGGYWPAGTQAVVTVPNSHRMLARVPADQKARAGGRNWVTIESGTRVVCLENLKYSRTHPIRSNSYPTDVLRVRVLEGTENGLELLFPHESFAAQPEPSPVVDRSTIALMFGFLILAFIVAHLIAAAAKAMRRRRELVRHWIETHPGERPPDRTRRHRPSPGVPSAWADDPTEWTAWLARRNAQVRKENSRPVRSGHRRSWKSHVNG